MPSASNVLILYVVLLLKKNRTNLRLHTRRTVFAGALPCCNIHCCDCCASRISIKLLILHTPTVHVFLHSFCCSYLKRGSRSFFSGWSISDFWDLSYFLPEAGNLAPQKWGFKKACIKSQAPLGPQRICRVCKQPHLYSRGWKWWFHPPFVFLDVDVWGKDELRKPCFHFLLFFCGIYILTKHFGKMIPFDSICLE